MKKIDIRDFMNYHYPTGLIAAPDGKHGVFAGVDVNGITKKLLPYLWAVAVVGVVISAVLYF